MDIGVILVAKVGLAGVVVDAERPVDHLHGTADGGVQFIVVGANTAGVDVVQEARIDGETVRQVHAPAAVEVDFLLGAVELVNARAPGADEEALVADVDAALDGRIFGAQRHAAEAVVGGQSNVGAQRDFVVSQGRAGEGESGRAENEACRE